MPFRSVVALYKRHERVFSSVSLFGGFAFDALTLRRVDTFWENFWIIVHLLVVGAAILVLNRRKEGKGRDAELDFWMVNILQFAEGGLLSAFLVFYFRSAVLSASWPFLLLLAAAFLANERLKRHYERLIFQVSFLFLSIFSFAIFIVPVLVGSIGPLVFVLSGVLSLFIIWGFLWLAENFSLDFTLGRRRGMRLSILAIFAAVNALYFTGLIPPIPLSLKDGGVYHFVHRDRAGDYVLETEKKGILDYLRSSQTLRVVPGETLFAYTAIFSPARLDTSIIHLWQYYDETTGKWTEVARVTLPIAGGREEGYRTYSESNVAPGKWRVDILTGHGQAVGRLSFNVLRVEAEPALVEEKH